MFPCSTVLPLRVFSDVAANSYRRAVVKSQLEIVISGGFSCKAGLVVVPFLFLRMRNDPYWSGDPEYKYEFDEVAAKE
jgi:hypothetical protein